MSREDFQKLIERYADGKPICNCRDAYYKPIGRGCIRRGDGNYEWREDLPACEYGCEYNRERAKEYVAERVVEELKEELANYDEIQTQAGQLGIELPAELGVSPSEASALKNVDDIRSFIMIVKEKRGKIIC